MDKIAQKYKVEKGRKIRNRRKDWRKIQVGEVANHIAYSELIYNPIYIYISYSKKYFIRIVLPL